MKLIPLLNEDTDAIDCIAKKVNYLPHPIKFRYQEPKCVVCGKKSQFKCSQCAVEKYCSRNCQKSHWNQHKSICKQSKEIIIN